MSDTLAEVRFAIQSIHDSRFTIYETTTMAKAREIIGLECEGGARDGIRRTLLTRLEEVFDFREQALDFSDIKGVHDMRVATRRLRSAARDFAPHMRRGRLDNVIDDLRELAEVLGSVRDLDVAISALQKLAADAPPELADGVLGIAEEREQQREEARRALVESLSAEAIDDFRQEFTTAVDRATRPRRPRKADSLFVIEPSFRTVSQIVALRLWQELKDRSPCLRRPFKVKPLHRMRISAKRLRYALELFTQCWGSDLADFAEEIAEIQGELGNLHDCDVWIDSLGAYLRDADQRDRRDDGAAGSTGRDAAVWLLSHFTEKRTHNYNDALARWYEWERRDFGARLAACVETVNQL